MSSVQHEARKPSIMFAQGLELTWVNYFKCEKPLWLPYDYISL